MSGARPSVLTSPPCSTSVPSLQYSPSFGLADQTELLGTQCISCAEGSMPVADGTVEAAIGTPVVTGATACSAW